MDLTAFLPILLLLLFIPIFLSGRRQRKQMAEMQQLQSSLTDGDVVMTTSGLRATVVDASYEETVDLEIAPGVVTTWVRAAVREKINPPTEGASDSESSSDGTATDGADATTTETPASDSAGGRGTA